jgi:two-component system phosphate regulon sensor histidine kinase PhoR
MEDELMRLEEVRTVFDNIRFETNPISGDFRLDSTRIHELLQKEFRSFKLDSAINWGVYDAAKNQFSIQPKEKVAFNYEVPLFKNDVIQPGRYILKLELVNNASMIWVDIRLMVFLSVIFILIILSVFVIALRLIIKHKKISQIKSDFINNMTHEFKTPLASISLAADSIIHPNVASDQSRIKEYVSIIQQEKTKLNQNVERILEVASLEKDAITFPEELINLTELIQQTVQNLQLVLQNKGGSISVLLTDSPQIRGSAFHLSQALSNILENSIKYSSKKPEIKISLTQQETRTEIKITDHGIGMTSDQLAKVFDSFYRAEAGNIHNTKGFGLGLTYSKFVIEKMGGKIEINSSLNKGTSVLVHFSKL